MTAPARPVPDVAAAEAVVVLMTEVSEGRLTAATMADRAAQRIRELFGECDGPTDPLWPVHVDLCRQVLGHGGLSAAELTEWLAVQRRRETGAEPPAPTENDASADTDAAEVDPFADVPDEVMAEAEDAALAVIDQYRREQREGETDD